MFGCSPWVNDDKLIDAIEAPPGACIVLSKHPRTAGGRAAADRLREINTHTNGIELRALFARHATKGRRAAALDRAVRQNQR